MCTLTFIPSESGQIITSNRDEHQSRGNSQFPVIQDRGNESIYFPQDPKAGGTWLAASNQKRISVLLNGAFERHSHRPPYRLSRGIVLLDSFNFQNLAGFSKQYDLDDIEPFTLVHFRLNNSAIEEVRWDGQKTSYTTLPFDTPHIWSSSSLYPKSVRDARESWFNQWLETGDLTPDHMINFHHFGGNGDIENSISMDRGNGLKTVSISQLVNETESLQFKHHNLMTDSIRSTVF